jgi:hypothetical protein
LIRVAQCFREDNSPGGRTLRFSLSVTKPAEETVGQHFADLSLAVLAFFQVPVHHLGSGVIELAEAVIPQGILRRMCREMVVH